MWDSGYPETMRLPVPDPRDLSKALLGLPERVFGLLESVEGVLDRVERLIDRIEATRADAEAVVRRTDRVVADVEPLVRRAGVLLDGIGPPLTALEPTLRTLADTTSPGEVAALVRMVDQLPQLSARVQDDVLPVLARLGSVAPDLHDLLVASQELNEMLGKLPGMGRIKRRLDEEHDEPDSPQDGQQDGQQQGDRPAWPTA